MCESGEDFTEGHEPEPNLDDWFWYELFPALCAFGLFCTYIALAIFLFSRPA